MNYWFDSAGGSFGQPAAPEPPSLFYLMPVQLHPIVITQTNAPISNRRAWTKEEDKRILELIVELGLRKNGRIQYKVLAKYFPGRTSKQIRERYLNNLDQSINKKPFSTEEDEDILTFYRNNGPKWRRLSTIMQGRTPSALKNRFNTKLKLRLMESKEAKDLSGASPLTRCQPGQLEIADIQLVYRLAEE